MVLLSFLVLLFCSELNMAPSSTYDQRSCIEITTSELSIMVGEGKKQRQALTGVSCSFGAAKLTALMGPSGAGKTTLLNALTGIGSIVKGKIAFNGGPRPNNFMVGSQLVYQNSLHIVSTDNTSPGHVRCHSARRYTLWCSDPSRDV